jgi:predicted DNA-binding transcriptional regulator AlpA
MNSSSDQPSEIPPSTAPNPDSENLWTTRQVAEFFHISAKSVFELRKKRGLPFVKLGGAVRFVPWEVREYLANSRRLTSHRLRQIARQRRSA